MANSDIATTIDSLMSFEHERQEKFLWEENEERITWFYVNELSFIDDEGKLLHGIPENYPAGYDEPFYAARDIPYIQLFTIAILKPDPNNANRKISVPVVMSLMKRRTTNSYVQLFKVIKTAFFEKFGRELKISRVMGDFECASRAAFVKEFNSCVSNCLFHTKQSWKRKIREFCGIDHYVNDDLTLFFKIMAGLVFVNPEFLSIAVEKMTEKIKTFDKKVQPGLKKFLKYFQNNYLNRDSYSGWTLHDNIDQESYVFTNNMLEGVHAQFKKLSGTGRNTIKRVSHLVHDFKIGNIAAIYSEDYNRTRKDVLERHERLRRRFEEIQLFAANKQWYSDFILEIALSLNAPDENILTFPDFIPTSSELTYTWL